MGKKTKDSRSECSTAKIKINSNITLESLLDVIISEYMQTTMVPAGKLLAGPRTNSEGYETITLEALCHYQTGCPKNFREFLASAAANDQTNPDFAWWARSRLRYSCSTITTTFVRFIVPYMKTLGITELRSLAAGCTIRMEDLEVFSLGFRPATTHAIALERPILPTQTEIVEPQMGIPLHCPHNVMKCSKTGVVIDCSLGQFVGTTKAYVFATTESFLSKIPGRVIYFHKTDKASMDEQVARDNAAFRSTISPDVRPARFTERVFRSIQDNKTHCGHCKGVASTGAKLKRCARCKTVLYCSGECQRLDWKTHKSHCVV